MHSFQNNTFDVEEEVISGYVTGSRSSICVIPACKSGTRVTHDQFVVAVPNSASLHDVGTIGDNVVQNLGSWLRNDTIVVGSDPR